MSYLAKESLARYSLQAVELWGRLEKAETPEEEEIVLKELWDNQTDQETAIDTQAELADQLDAEITAVKARLKHLAELHSKEIEKLERWRKGLDKTLLYFNFCGILPDRLVGKLRHIRIEENPPSCEVMIGLEELPAEFRTEKTIYTADKRKIIAAWKKGIPVNGTHVERKRRVKYSIIAGNLADTADTLDHCQSNKTNGESTPKKSKKKALARQ